MKATLLRASLFFVLAFSGLRAQAAPAPVILAINYESPDAEIHIGSYMTVYMTAIFPSQAINVSVTAVDVLLGQNITLGSTALNSLAGQVIYITDGKRVWALTHLGGSSITIGDGQLLGGGLAAPIFKVAPASYVSLVNQAFTAYTGSLMVGFDPGSPNMRVTLGDFDYTELRDSGPGPINPDYGANDGIWTGLYFVPDLGFTVTNGSFFGTAIENGQPNLAPFQSVVTFNLDGLRPAIEVISFTTNRPSLNGVLYLSSLSQGSTTPNTTNSQGRFDVTVNKRNIIVNIHIDDGLVTPFYSRDLPPLVIQASSTNLNGWLTWDGDTNAGVFVPDGQYKAVLSIIDHHGVTGSSLTTTVKVISMKMQIKDIALNPAAITSEPSFTNSVITNLSYAVELSNDSNSSLNGSLNALGWTTAGLYPINNDVRNVGLTAEPAYDCLSCSVWSLPETRFLFPDGSEAIEFPGNDGNGSHDDDWNKIHDFRGDPRFYPVTDCNIYNPDFINTTTTATATNGGDGNITNDYSLMGQYMITAGSGLAPTRMRADMGVIFVGDTPAEGNYRLQIRSTLTGMNYTHNTFQGAFNFVCGFSTFLVASEPNHFFPTARPVGPTYLQGENMFAEDTSVFFKVSRYQAPVSDTTAPYVVTSDPISDGQVSPGIYGPSRPLTAEVRDNESPMSVQPSVTYSRVFDPTGGPVGGSSATNGGGINNSVNLIFTPFSPLKSGGTYTLQINACNVSGLCIQKDLKFTIKDETPPDVASVEVFTQTSLSPYSLPLNQASPFGTALDNVTQIWAALAMPPTSINVIDWDLSNISLNRISGTTSITVPVTRTTAIGSIPSDGKLKFRLISPITTAGLFEVVVQSFSKDLSGQGYSGPPSPWINPQFNTVVNSAVLDIKHPNGIQTAISGQQPLTATVMGSGVTYTPTIANMQAVLPAFTGVLAPPAGMQPLTVSASMSHALQFAIVGPGTLFSRLRWDSVASTTLRFTLYYNDADLPAGVTNANLDLRGNDGTSWQTVSAVHTSTNGIDNTFVITIPTGSTAFIAYAIFYAVASPNITPSPSPTAVAYPLTRSFNPTHSNPLFRLARFFYSKALPKEVEAKVYDTSGQLVRSLSLGRGILASDILSDPYYGSASYFFTWDGRNDSGNLVKNGIYLVRWRVLRFDGSSDVQTRPVALIK